MELDVRVCSEVVLPMRWAMSLMPCFARTAMTSASLDLVDFDDGTELFGEEGGGSGFGDGAAPRTFLIQTFDVRCRRICRGLG